MPKCKVCGAELAEGVKFCGNCGAPQETKTTCKSCGAELAEGAKFCGKCGASVAQPSTRPEQARPESQAQPQNSPDAAAATAYLAGQNGKIREAAGRIMDTYRLQRNNPNKGGIIDGLFVMANMISEMAAPWEGVVRDIESTKEYIAKIQCSDIAYQNAANDFSHSCAEAIQGIKLMRSESGWARLGFPITLVVSIALLWMSAQINDVILVIALIVSVGISIGGAFISYQSAKQKKLLDLFLRRIESSR